MKDQDKTMEQLTAGENMTGEVNEKVSILIVDDDESTCRMLSLLFRKEGYGTETAASGREAMEKVRERFFNVALLDIKLPDMEGTELLMSLKRIYPDTVMIMVTAHASLEASISALLKGASAYLPKPLNMKEVLATVREAVEKQHLAMENKRLYQEAQRELAERKQAEETLRRERDNLIRILEAMEDGVCIINQQYGVEYVNLALEAEFGAPEEQKCYQYFHDREEPCPWCQNQDVFTGKTIRWEHHFSKNQKTYELIDTPLKNPDGSISKLGILRDVTESRRLRKKMVEYEELDKLKTSLLSTVSHELRTPLAVIKGYSTMLLDYDQRLSSNEKSGHLRSIDKATDRLTDLVDHLLDMSRLDAGLLRLQKAPASISRVIKDAVAEAQLRVPGRKIALQVRNRLPRVNIDAGRIRQVLDNLIDNAIKYSGEGCSVVVEAGRNGGELDISVTDQGMGISPEDLERVFDRMYRLEQRLSSDPGGMGLGLALCKALVEAHSGRIWVESAVDKGSTFHFTLPLTVKKEKEHD